MQVDSLVTRLTALLCVLALNVSLSPPVAATSTRIGQITKYRLPTGYVGPYAITAGPNGNVWFGDDAGQPGYNARITPTGQIMESRIPGCGGVADMVVGPDGRRSNGLMLLGLRDGPTGRCVPALVICQRDAITCPPDRVPAHIA